MSIVPKLFDASVEENIKIMSQSIPKDNVL